MEAKNQSAPFIVRFWAYQKERFPIFAHGPLIVAFTFSTVAYSRLSRGEESFIVWSNFWPGLVIAFTFFLLMRILDEHKDAENDRKFRQYLPVPRGLISLAELRNLGITIVLVQILLIAFFQPSLWWLYAIMMGYLLLMTVEFFVPKWISEKPILYMFSHMAIMPLFDLYSSGMDWKLNEYGFHNGLIIFLAVSFFNGTVLEVGRKIKTPQNEEKGIKSYTQALGTKTAAIFWLMLLSITFALAFYALDYANLSLFSKVLLTVFFIAVAIPTLLFIKNPKPKLEKIIEVSSGLWTLGMYLILGGVPMLLNSF